MEGGFETSDSHSTESRAAARPPGRWRAAASLVGLLLFLAGGLLARVWMRPVPAPVARFDVDTGPRETGMYSTNIAISPDGQHLAYIAGDRPGQELRLRLLSRFESTTLVADGNPASPFFLRMVNGLGIWISAIVCSEKSRCSEVQPSRFVDCLDRIYWVRHGESTTPLFSRRRGPAGGSGECPPKAVNPHS